MNRAIISIIVPVYNASAYISKSLSSIQKQTFKDWECICVDDGSTDNSTTIIEDFTKKDKRFRLIKQQNRGPGAARNTGLDIARGQYFTFIDADDLIHPSMFEKLLYLAQTHDADLVVCDYFRFKSEEQFDEFVANSEFLTNRIEVREAPLLPKMVDWKKFRVHPWGKLYHNVYYGELRFPHLNGPEDAYASFDVYGRSDCTVFSNMRLYGYRIVDSGLVLSISKYRNYIAGDAQVAMHCEKICRKQGLSKDLTKKLMMSYIMRMFGYLNDMSIDSRLSKKEKKTIIELGHKMFRDIKKSPVGKYNIIPPIHYITYTAVCLNALWLLIFWQFIRIHILKRSLRLLKISSI